MEKAQFINEFSDLLRRLSEPRHKFLDYLLRKFRKRSRWFRKFELNNPEVFRSIENARDIPVEKVRMLITDLYNSVHDKRDTISKP